MDKSFDQDALMDDRKGELRSKMRSLRNGLPLDARVQSDEAICARVCELPAFKSAEILFAYLAFGTEVETRPIIELAWRAGKQVVLPRCTAPREMRWFRISSFEGLEKSSLGVEEPSIDVALEVDPRGYAKSLALVPGLTFDERGYRLGYGGGFYDAFLADFPGVSVGLCRLAQRSENLEALGVIDVCDKPTDMVVFA